MLSERLPFNFTSHLDFALHARANSALRLSLPTTEVSQTRAHQAFLGQADRLETRRNMSFRNLRHARLPTISEDLQFPAFGSSRLRRNPKQTEQRRSWAGVSLPLSREPIADFSNLKSDKEEVARLEGELREFGLRRRLSSSKMELWDSIYPPTSTIEAIPDVNPEDILKEHSSSDHTSDSEDDSSFTLEASDPVDQDFSYPWQETSPPDTDCCRIPTTREQRKWKTSPSVESARTFLEISKDNFEPLRGADEMIEAMNARYVSRTRCLLCSADLLCIADVAYVICCDCRSLCAAPRDESGLCYFGVGLGMHANGDALP